MSAPASPPEPDYRRGRGALSTDTAAFEVLLARVGRETPGGDDADAAQQATPTTAQQATPTPPSDVPPAPAEPRPVTEPVSTWTASVPAQGQPMTRREAREAREREAREAEARERESREAAAPVAAPVAAPEPTPTTGSNPTLEEALISLATGSIPVAQTDQLTQPRPATSAPAPAPAPDEQHHDHDFHWLHGLHGGDDGGSKPPKGQKPKRRGRRALTWIISTVVILGMLGGGAYFAWTTFQPQVQALVGKFHHEPNDWTGDGTGSVDVSIKQGDTGTAIGDTLAAAGVIRTSQAFYQLLLQSHPEPQFQPGVYRLRTHMSAASALALLQDPKSKLAHTLLIREGDTEATVLKAAASATGIPIARLQAAAKNPAAFGLPAQAKSLEGFLYPATYTLDPGQTPQQVISTLVDRAKQEFSDLGITDAQLWNTVILASIVQREAGPFANDLPLIAGVFKNRIAAGMPLQSDATVMYGTGKTGSVWTSDADRANAANPYNTYIHKGLTPGPIGNPGAAALQAAMHPQGDYLYFTAVNLRTGQSAFAKTEAEHEANVAKLHTWCAQPDNASYCK